MQDNAARMSKFAPPAPMETLTIDESADLIVLPLSPEADVPQGPREFVSAAGIVGTPHVTMGGCVPALEVLTFETDCKQTLWRPLGESVKRTYSKAEPLREVSKPTEEICSLLQGNVEQAQADSANGRNSTIFLMDLPDRRRKKRGRKEAEKVLSLEAMSERNVQEPSDHVQHVNNNKAAAVPKTVS